MPATHPIIAAHLSVGYGHRAVLSDISLTLAQGTLTCLIGPNGAGKSTLLRTLAGYQPPMAGRMLIGGLNLQTLTMGERAQVVSVVLTDRIDAVALSVTEIVAMGRAPYTGLLGTTTAADRLMVAQALEMVGISHLATRRIGTLSDGERQKVMVARALAQHTPVILLDEPTAFLDFTSKVALMRLLSHLAATQAKTILMSTHDLEIAAAMADNLIEIHEHTICKTTAAVVRARIAQLLQR